MANRTKGKTTKSKPKPTEAENQDHEACAEIAKENHTKSKNDERSKSDGR